MKYPTIRNAVELKDKNVLHFLIRTAATLRFAIRK